ncbi:ABC transporter ATP-binding protein [Zooshikella ganghwensis]|uniref:ABC transporter ATP-binding protein n=1 Tax=Zooshikella ganghwensis TaxID=202772 RepID=A0A4P9VUN8_9GAMM|nr:ABC transporter ATP-binding protein [Zooshikella ganghwensis]RDH46052.1 ABC transporter ATP-binding protein [Zooshikella ganghwensis]
MTLTGAGAAFKKLEITDVVKSYGSKCVLDDIDLHVSHGEFCTLVGPSGCGKSTLLRLILGQEQSDQGSILVEGQPVGFPDPYRGIVFQKYSLFPHLSVLDNVLLGKHLTHQRWWMPWRRQSDWKEEAMSLLERVRLAEAAEKYPHELSGGMQQRAAIAQALIMKHPILLMDEPFGALDPDTREDLQIFLLDIWEKEQLTIFFVTHDLEEACFLGSRLLVLSQYYTDDRGNGPSVNRGGKIVADHSLKNSAGSTVIKDQVEFRDLIESVRREGFSPEIRQHVDNFNLNHPDSFRTLNEY